MAKIDWHNREDKENLMTFTLPAANKLPNHPLIIGDERLIGGSGVKVAHIYPGTGTVTREIAMANADDVDRAVAAARAAFPAWKAMPGDKRRNLFFKLAELCETRSAEFAPSLISENGSVAMIAPYMGYDAAQKFRYFGGWCDKIHGRTVPMWGVPAHDYVAFEPYGVVGIIVPWNGPLFAATMVMAPALAAGNTVLLKSPDLAPYSAMKLVELMLEVGFPPGVVNLVTGAADVGEAMVAHPGIDKIEFIGSGATAKKVLTSAAQSLKPVGLELGGKSAVIVFEDADLMLAAKKGISGAVSSNGQGCVNGTRLLVHRPVYDQYLQILAGVAGAIKVGDPFDPATNVGPVISKGAMERILGMVERGVANGGRIISGGERLGGEHGDGYFLPITILADVANDSEIGQTEVFGPVLTVTPFDSEEEAIVLANGTEYGLGAYVHTQNLRRAHHVTSQLEAGMIHVNGSGEAMQPNCPFGGWKKSGHGRLGGIEGLQEFLQPKNIWMSLAAPEG
jgi:acyl-CoA reductase-like NAD-dependent aldehyde dehydrogenase